MLEPPFYLAVYIGPGKAHLGYNDGTGIRPVCGSHHNKFFPYFRIAGYIDCRRCRAKLDKYPMLPVHRTKGTAVEAVIDALAE